MRSAYLTNCDPHATLAKLTRSERVYELFMSTFENEYTLLRRNKNCLLRKEIIKRFIFIKVFKTYFSINSVSFATQLVYLHQMTAPILPTMNNTLIIPVITSTSMMFLLPLFLLIIQIPYSINTIISM